MNVGDLVKIDDNHDGMKGKLALVIQTLPSTAEVVVQCVESDTPWIFQLDQLMLVSEVRK